MESDHESEHETSTEDYDKFEDLARKLLKVSKAELDAEREKAAARNGAAPAPCRSAAGQESPCRDQNFLEVTLTENRGGRFVVQLRVESNEPRTDRVRAFLFLE